MLELRWSRKKLSLYLSCAIAFVLFGLLAASEPWWQRVLFTGLGCLATAILIRRLRAAANPVLILSPDGIQDVRLIPQMLRWSAVSCAEYEPKYARGGAIVLDLAPGIPVPEVRNPHMTTRGQDASISGRRLRLTLGDLAFSPDAVRSALSQYSKSSEHRAV